MSSNLDTLPLLSLSISVHILSKAAGGCGGNVFLTNARHSVLLRVFVWSTSYLGHTFSTNETHFSGSSPCLAPSWVSYKLDDIFVILSSLPASAGLMNISVLPPLALSSTCFEFPVAPSILPFSMPGKVSVTLKPFWAWSFVSRNTAPWSLIRYY